MEHSEVCCQILDQLAAAIKQLDPADFTRPSSSLSNATIGQHVRHTLEFFHCLELGLATGAVNYDHRERRETLENSKSESLAALERIKSFLDRQTANCPMILEVSYERGGKAIRTVPSNYFRELSYNIEHLVHHMALIKIGLREVAPYVKIPAEFGVAISTLRHLDSLIEAQ